jgi:hypothetical protein
MPRTIRPIRIDGNIAYVPLTKGYEAVIDVADVPLVEGWNWTASTLRRAVYAYRRPRVNGVLKSCLMHRLIADPGKADQVDHINGNGLDNRRKNLRLATPSENACNSVPRSTNTSGFKGVCWHKGAGKWMAQIVLDGKNNYLGLFDTAEDAHAAYAKKSLELHGRFGRCK